MATSKKNNNKDKPIYHEFEFSICGFSGSGKSTLIQKLISHYSNEYSVGFVKSDVHSFQMDKEGKDTQKMWSHGAAGVHIFDRHHQATIDKSVGGLLQNRQFFYDKDFVLVEGRKQSSLPKAIMLDDRGEILEMFQSGGLSQVQAIIGPEKENPNPTLDLPYFQRDDVGSLSAFILNHFSQKIRLKPLFGMVLSGGRSQRMQKDKALLSYQGQPQLLRAAQLLEPFCEKVFLSYREGQENRHEFSGYEPLLDRFVDFGPMGGILSGMTNYREATWLVLACDLPFLDSQSLEFLVHSRKPFKLATAYESAHDVGRPEPLCAIYESRSIQQLLGFLALGDQCPRKMLMNSNIELLKPLNNQALDNVNFPHEYEAASGDLINVRTEL